MEEKLRDMLLETVEENTIKMSKRVESPLSPSSLLPFLTQSSLTLSLKKKKKKGRKRKSVKCFPLKSRNLQRIHAFYYKHGSSTF